MIGRLLRKDILLNWSMIVVIVGGLVLVVALNRFADRAVGERVYFGLILFYSSLYASLLPLLSAVRTERYRTDAFDCSLPVTRRQTIAAKYLLPVLLLPLWVALTYGTVGAFSAGRIPLDALHAETLLLAPAALVVVVGLFYPLVMRVGLPGMLYGAVGLQIVGVVLAVAVRRVPGIRGLFDAVGRIGPAMRGLHADIGDPWFALAADALYRGKDL